MSISGRLSNGLLEGTSTTTFSSVKVCVLLNVTDNTVKMTSQIRDCINIFPEIDVTRIVNHVSMRRVSSRITAE